MEQTWVNYLCQGCADARLGPPDVSSRINKPEKENVNGGNDVFISCEVKIQPKIPKLLYIICRKSETFSKEVYGTVKTHVSQICIQMTPQDSEKMLFESQQNQTKQIKSYRFKTKRYESAYLRATVNSNVFRKSVDQGEGIHVVQKP